MVKMRVDELQEFVKTKIAKIRKLAPMNEELQKWIEEKDNQDKKDVSTLRKNISGKCRICHERPAQYRCIKCGTEVCATHYWLLLGLCKKCVSDDMLEKWGGEKKLGIDIIK